MEEIDGLVHEASKGDDNAFLALWKLFYPKILNYLRRFTRDAEDLCSETWIRIARSIRGFQGDGNAFKAWIFTIARNLAIDHSRKLKRRGFEEEIHEEDWIREDKTSIEITDLLDGLPKDQSEVILLRVVMEFTAKETAEITGKSESNVRVLAHRGLNTLKKKIEEHGYGDRKVEGSKR